MKITIDEPVHDNKTFPKLVNDVMKSNKKITIGKLIVEYSAYDINGTFG
ncbi:MAG TPA: hypothetical protein VN704_03960 [Verrucomicrobiae bacterium]|nr:hypothetical protein [Verrucomicrobiae bacterium]